MIYVVDDTADYRFLVQQVFKLYLPQYTLQLFGDGLELMRHTEQDPSGLNRPCVIVLDVDMPKLSGPQTLERLKQTPVWQQVPAIMMSNRADPEFVMTCYRLGAGSFFYKPMDLNGLKEIMELICRYWIDCNQLPAGTSSFSPKSSSLG